MKYKNIFKIFYWCIAGVFIVSCNFPYQPKQFVLPELPNPFAAVSPDSIVSFFGTSNVKFAYTLKEGSRWVYFIDFNDPAPAPTKLKKPSGKETVNGDSPLISPNGMFVAYYLTPGATPQGAYMQRLDGSASPVLIAENGTEPHWWTDADSQLYVLYSDQIMSTALVAGANFTYRQKVSLAGNGSIVGAPEPIAPYPMNGGMSSNGKYLCTGYINAAFYDLADSVLLPINNGFQTCNPSIDPDNAHPNWMMFLNIHGPQNLNNPFLGNVDFPSSQLVDHEIIFIVNSDNTVVDYVTLASLEARYGSYEELQDPEWSNDPRFSTTLGVINGTDADAVIIKNVGNGGSAKQSLRLTTGKFKLNDTSTPYVWIGK